MPDKPTLDDSVERDPVTLDDLESVFKALLRPTDSRPRSENRSPTNEELGRRLKLRRREQGDGG